MKRIVVFCCALLLSPEASLIAQQSRVQTGEASYYGREFHGQRTANGETHSMWQLTAAHPTLPFHTLVKVTNLGNEKSVVVRVNDAGPFKRGRIIDLSRQAALELDMLQSGTARVRLEVVGRAEPTQGMPDAGDYQHPNSGKADLQGFGIQLASYSDERNVVRKLAELERKGIDKLVVQPVKIGSKNLQRVILGGFSTREEAEARLGQLRKSGIDGFVFQIR